MGNKVDNTKFISVAVIIGLVVTVSLGFILMYLSSLRGFERDEVYAKQCRVVTSSEKNYDVSIKTFRCGEEK